MKLVRLFAIAGFAVTGLMGATTAKAQDWRHRDHHERRWDRQDRWERHARWDRHRGWDRGRHDGWHRDYRYRGRTVCWSEWHHGRRVQVCRRR